MAIYIIILGPPGAGKGTQAARISKKFDLAHISSGDIFREHLRNQTQLGKLAQEFMNRGELVPDDVTIEMIKDRLNRPDCKNGAILDGFPRTPNQAKALDKMLAGFGEEISSVPLISVPSEALTERLTGRRVCRAEGHVYHLTFNPPKEPGVCDVDGSPLYQRDDDEESTVLNRLQVYQKQTEPLIDYYSRKGKIIKIDGTLEIDQVTEALFREIKKVE